MKSISNHFSLVVALLSILFTIQIFIIIDRSVDSYKKNLATTYSVVVVSQKTISKDNMLSINSLIENSTELNPDNVIKRLNANVDAKNIELLKLSLPKFYKLKMMYYPKPIEITKLTKDLLKHKYITKVEDFSNTHDTTYKLLLLIKNIISIFAGTIFIVTTLLILKELRIWQFKHTERMNIMGLFGSPIWLSSAVLFRLAIVDAIISSLLVFLIFTYLSSSSIVLEHLANIGIDIIIFDNVYDFAILSATAISLSILLAIMIVIGHKEEV